MHILFHLLIYYKHILNELVGVICNEKGKINRDIGNDIIFGYSDNRSKFILGLEQQDINSLF